MSENDADLPDLPPPVAGYMLGAPDDIRNAHNRALIWCQATQTQIQRVRQARLDFMAAYNRAEKKGLFGDDEYMEPPRRMEAEILMMFIAARQLLRAARRFDPQYSVPSGVDRERVRLLRNALEHWDQDQGESIDKLKAANVDPNNNRWRPDGSGVVGDVDDRDLETWVQAIHDDIKTWDPYDESWLKSHGYPTGFVAIGQVIP